LRVRFELLALGNRRAIARSNQVLPILVQRRWIGRRLPLRSNPGLVEKWRADQTDDETP
jgi:hypothetical protein